MLTLILSDIVAILLLVAAGVAYYFNDKLTAAFVISSICTYYYGRHITNVKGGK